MVVFEFGLRLETHEFESRSVEILDLLHIFSRNWHLFPSIIYTVPDLILVELRSCFLTGVGGGTLERLVSSPVHLSGGRHVRRSDHLVELYPYAHVRLQSELTSSSNSLLKLLVSDAIH